MTSAQVSSIKARMTTILTTYASAAPARVAGIFPVKGLKGKMYEVSVLAEICENLVQLEGLTLRMVNRGSYRLRAKGGPINRAYPYIEVFKNGQLLGEIFTDIEFKAQSMHLRGTSSGPGDFHELDIAMVIPGIRDRTRPNFDEIMIGVECKNTPIEKNIIREVLGFRRELSMVVSTPLSTAFTTWPASSVHSNPSSVHMLFCSYMRVLQFRDNCEIYGTLLHYYPV